MAKKTKKMRVTQVGPRVVPGGICKYIEQAYQDGTTVLLDKCRWTVRSIKPYPDTERERPPSEIKGYRMSSFCPASVIPCLQW